jgi:hypothetical protein
LSQFFLIFFFSLEYSRETPGVAWFIFTGPVAFLLFVGGEAIWIYDQPNTHERLYFFFRGEKKGKKMFLPIVWNRVLR